MKIAVEYAALAPIIIMLGAGVVAMLIEAFAPRSARRSLELLLTFGSIAVSFVYVVMNFTAQVDETVNNGGQHFGVRELLDGRSATRRGDQPCGDGACVCLDGQRGVRRGGANAKPPTRIQRQRLRPCNGVACCA